MLRYASVREMIEACPQLTHRERECLALASDGKPDKQIAHLLRINPRTVKNHLRLARSRLTASSRAHAVTMVINMMIDGHAKKKAVSSLARSRPKP